MMLSEERVYELEEAAFSQGVKVYEIVPADEKSAYKKYCLSHLEYLLERLSCVIGRDRRSQAARKSFRIQIKEMKEAISAMRGIQS